MAANRIKPERVAKGSRHTNKKRDARRANCDTPGVDYRDVFERSPEAILLFDRNGVCIDANQRARKLTGFSRTELAGNRLADLTGPHGRGKVPATVEPPSGCDRVEITLTTKGGARKRLNAVFSSSSRKLTQVVLRPIVDESPRPSDSAADHATATIVDLCQVALVSADMQGRIRSWNPAAAALFGYDEDEALGMAVTRLIPPNVRRKHRAAFAKRLREPSAERLGQAIQTSALRRDGTIVPVELVIGVTWRDERPNIVAAIRDVSEQHELAERLNDALQRLRFHIDRMPLGYIVFDTNFAVVEWNKGAEMMFGYTAKEAYGRKAYDLIVPPDVIPTVEQVWLELLKGDTSSHSINDNVHKDGTRLKCEWFNTALRDRDGSIIGVAAMVMDMTQRDEIEARIRDTQKIESIGVLARGVAHDFNSALMVMMGRTSLLRRIREFPPEAQEHLDVIEEAGFRARDLIDHLLAYARTGRHNPQRTNVNTALRSAHRFAQSSVGSRCMIRLCLAKRLPTIYADRAQLEQIILNLCLNAAHAMAEGGVIEITTKLARVTEALSKRFTPSGLAPGRYVEMVVKDTGCGMDQSTVARAFDPFFAIDSRGHGLGLSVVLGILRQHNGGAFVESVPGKGTSFHIYLPVREVGGRGATKT
ncbi:MAG: PAS domain S-box protein [Planctomycetes bacterium]|nr:PAS domain S-box protein [Planctomycetota bacterium]